MPRIFGAPFLTFGCAAALLLSACTQSGSSGSPKVAQHIADEKIDASNYIGGHAFCDIYKDADSSKAWRGTSAEIGKRIDVPVDYDDPSKGTLSIYAWTLHPMKPNVQTIVYVTGGPGGNSHGDEDMFSAGEFNVVYFDQRGLGCSAPDTYEQYQDVSIYSNENTIRDMDAVRVAYGLDKWTPYGTSYGTAVATMYGHQYPSHVNTIILDGTVYRGFEGVGQFRADKLNLVLAQLNSTQRQAFSDFMKSDQDGNMAVQNVMMEMLYQDDGPDILVRGLLKSFDASGNFKRDVFVNANQKIRDRDNRWGRPQGPGLVDNNVLLRLDCTEMGIAAMYEESTYYSTDEGQFTVEDDSSWAKKDCQEAGVTIDPLLAPIFDATLYPLTVPVTYFEGTDDGATIPSGAISHWRNVAKGQKFLLLRQKGGHCPATLALWDSSNATAQAAQRAITAKAILGTPISQSDLTGLNIPLQASDQWKLYLSDGSADQVGSRPEDALGGL